MRNSMRRLCCLLLLFAASACTPDYPFDKEGTWQLPPLGSNDANLRTMIVNPRDLVAGQGESTTVGAEAAPPVRRLVTGNRYPLPASDVVQLNLVNPPSQQPTGQDSGNAGQ
jgi:hypothetical protein